MRPRLRGILVAAIVASSALVIAAEHASAPEAARPEKRPWEWTLDERVAARSNAALARMRVGERHGMRVVNDSASARKGPPPVDAFDGKTHPELFLPNEVFRTLIHLAYLKDPRHGQMVREGLMADVRRHELPPDFWERLRARSSIYIADSLALEDIALGLRAETGPARRRAEAAVEMKQVDVCRSRADALAGARAEFGQERFDRFLYDVIAVNMFSVTDRVADRKTLLWAEEGC